MKNLIYSSIIVAALAFGCSDDEGIPAPTTEPVTLEFNVKSLQDQMGDFAHNEMVYYDGHYWSVGGENDYNTPGEPSSDVWKSTNGINWVSVTSGKFPACKDHQLAVFLGKMWLIGGKTTGGGILTSVYSSTDGVTWDREVTTPPFGFVSGHSLTVKDGKMWLIKAAVPGNEVWSTVNGTTWVRETTAAFPYTLHFKTVVFNDYFYILGGREVSMIPVNRIWRSRDGITWEEIIPTTPIFSGRTGHTAVVHDGRMWVIGGQTATEPFSSELWYSENGENWLSYVFPTPPADGLRHHSSLVQDGVAWIFGGEQSTGNTGEIRCFKIM